MTRTLALVCLSLAACTGDSDAPLAIDGLVAYAALPGQDRGVAYLTVSNGGRDALILESVDSPEFRAVEMHETLRDNGIASMLKLDAFHVPPGSSVRFSPGGRHLMLIDPLAKLAPGSEVTLEFHYRVRPGGELKSLALSTVFRARGAGE